MSPSAGSIRASFPFLLVGSVCCTNSTQGTKYPSNDRRQPSSPCVHDQTSALQQLHHERGYDKGCSMTQPFCVDRNNRRPSLGERGIRCVPCVSDHPTPMEPDWGCSVTEPLCMDETGGYPEQGSAGVVCKPYPCNNTRTHPADPDQGCTSATPTCVDVLGNEPPRGKPGVQCVSHSPSLQAAWGLPDSKRVNTANCLTVGQSDLPQSPEAGKLPLCHSCAFGVSQKCELGSIRSLAW